MPVESNKINIFVYKTIYIVLLLLSTERDPRMEFLQHAGVQPSERLVPLVIRAPNQVSLLSPSYILNKYITEGFNGGP